MYITFARDPRDVERIAQLKQENQILQEENEDLRSRIDRKRDDFIDQLDAEIQSGTTKVKDQKAALREEIKELRRQNDLQSLLLKLTGFALAVFTLYQLFKPSGASDSTQVATMGAVAAIGMQLASTQTNNLS